MKVFPSPWPQLACTKRRLPSPALQRASNPNDCTLVTRPMQSSPLGRNSSSNEVAASRFGSTSRSARRSARCSPFAVAAAETRARVVPLSRTTWPVRVAWNERAFHGLGEKRNGPVATTTTAPAPAKSDAAAAAATTRSEVSPPTEPPPHGRDRARLRRRPRKSASNHGVLRRCRCPARGRSPRPRRRG